MVTDFIRALDLSNVSYIFAVVTAGGGQGYSLRHLEHSLLEKGKKLDYGKYIRGVSNYIVAWYYKFMSPTDERRADILKKLSEKADHIAFEVSIRRRAVEKKANSLFIW